MSASLRPIGYYVHYHGQGHRNRTRAILREFETYGRPVTILASRMAGLPWPGSVTATLELPCDIDDVPSTGREHADDLPALHFAPLHTENIRRRVFEMTRWFAESDPAAVVVDVSSEVAMLARLASVPTIVMRQHGDRRDPGHENAYHAAARLLAPFPEQMEDEITPDWVRKKTTYADGFCRYDQPAPSREQARRSLEWTQPHVVVMTGRGGDGSSRERIAAAARATPDWIWIVIGTIASSDDREQMPANVRIPGWIDDPLHYLAAADAVISAAGHNSVMELAHSRAKVVLIPEERPFEEQTRKAAILSREKLAVVRDAWPAAWGETLAEAEAIDASGWDSVVEGDGAATLSAAIDAFAEESAARWPAADTSPKAAGALA